MIYPLITGGALGSSRFLVRYVTSSAARGAKVSSESAEEIRNPGYLFYQGLRREIELTAVSPSRL